MMEERHSHGSNDDIQNTGDADNFRRNQGTILFVGNLPFQTPWQHVKDYFRNAGKVRYTDLIADRTGRPKGSALVTMMTVEGADNAIRMFNETDFEGRRLIVRKFDDGPRPPLVQRDMMPAYGNAAPQSRSQYTAGGYYQGTSASGAAAAGYNRHSMAGSAYGRGAPYHVGGAEAAEMNGAEPLPKPRSQQVPEVGRKLFVSNLPFDCTNSALRETFQQVGLVERAEIILGRNGKSRGMGIVVMKSEDEAQIAIAEFDGIEMANRAMNVRLDNKTL
ncbi:RNA-binding protein, putative [Leishmania panamensis]|uniref:RNA-binding protein, putative n=3 Tax=Leishmania guyanensis species complex TaxID=38579 RepID=A0A088S0U8_LEIPA|nr:RNA-binding protein, putative [Leishmania panamensis]AIO01831.1 RNA-binding protein, putative [Leishmania panamensis]CCM18881.1 RNA-binding protein, putative [Leishmania guyanensis]